LSKLRSSLNDSNLADKIEGKLSKFEKNEENLSLEEQLKRLLEIRNDCSTALTLGMNCELYFLFPIRFTPLQTNQQNVILSFGKQLFDSHGNHSEQYLQQLLGLLKNITLPVTSSTALSIPCPEPVSRPKPKRMSSGASASSDNIVSIPAGVPMATEPKLHGVTTTTTGAENKEIGKESGSSAARVSYCSHFLDFFFALI
jgi:hypothetical protein